MEQYRNWKVNLVLLMKDKVQSDVQIDLINTVSDVTRVTVNREGYTEAELGVAAYDITGVSSGKAYTIRVYATLSDVTRIGRYVYDNTTQATLLNIIGYEVDLDRSTLVGFNLSGGYPLVNPDNTLLPIDFCREADYRIKLTDQFGNPLCARIGALPEIILEPGPTTIYRGGVWVEPGYTAQDADDGDLTEHVLVDSSLNVNVIGSYIIRYTVTDTDSQTVTVIRTINVIVPDLVPVLTLLPNASGSITPINIIEGDQFTDPGVLAQDAEDGDISNQVVVTGDVLNTVPGSYILTYTVTDSAGNVNHMDRIVNVLANTLPIITLNVGNEGIVTPIVIPAGHSWVEPGYTASDTEDGDITSSVVVTGDTVDTAIEGNYTITYTVTDNNGGTTTAHRVVQVISNTLPTITLLPDARGDTAVLVLQIGHSWIDPGYTASDIEDGDISNRVLMNGTVDNTLLGTNVITYSVTDTAGNTVSVNRTITVIDPILSLSLSPDENNRTSPMYVLETNDTSTIVDPGVAASITINGVTTDATNSVVVTRDFPANFIAGDTGTITYTLVDQYGMNTTSLVRVVKAAALPTITMLAPSGQVATPIVAVQNTGLVVPGATARDYLLQDITADIVVSGDVVDNTTPGTYTVVYTVSDTLGLTTSETRIVNILSNSNPSITLLPNDQGDLTPLNIPYGLPYTDPGATAYDPEDGDVTNNIVTTNNVDTSTSGSYTITYSVTDTSGTTILANRTVVVADNAGPVITLTEGSPYEIVENIVWVEPGYVALDNEQGNITADVVITGDTVDTSTIGTYTLLYTVVDQGGLTDTATRVVNVIANNAPVIDLVSGDTYKRLVGPTWVDPGYTATDSEDGNISAAVVITGTVDSNTIGQYSLSYSVTDTSNTTTTVERQVYILSDGDLAIAMRNPPVGPPASPMEWNLGQTWVDPGADVYNPEGENVNQYLQTSGTVDTGTVGTYTVTYTATDNYGRSDTIARTVNVVLVNLEPAITLSGGNSIEWVQNTPWVDPGYSAYDIEDGDITANIVITGDNFDVAVLGTYYIHYDVTDSGGKSATETRVVYLVPPNVAPTISLLGGNFISIPNNPNAFNDPGWYASDNEDGDISSSVVVGGDTVNTSINGTYVVTYDVTDSGGLTAHEERTVTVTADLVPTISLIGGEVNVLQGTIYSEPGYSAYDNEDGDLTGAVIVDEGGLDTTIEGTYTLTYTVTDSVGHSGTASRTVNVVADDLPPILTLIGNNPLHMPQYSNYIEPGYFAQDAIDGNITSNVTITDNIDPDVFGTYTRTYTIVDSGGNSVSEDRTVIVDFVNKLPVLTLTNGSNIYWPNGLAWQDPGFSAIDNEDGDITADVVIGGVLVDTDTDGDYGITYTITDSNGGVVSKTRTVHVVPNTPPTISLIEHPDDLGDAYHISLLQGHIWEDPGYTAYDGQQGVMTSQVVVGGDTIDEDVPGTYNITYTVVDNMGVSVTVTRVVTYTPDNVPNIILTPWVGQNDAYNVTLPWGTPWVEPGYTATDVEDGIITNDVVIAGDTVDTSSAGVYVVSYSVTDSYNQTKTVNRNVIIQQNLVPTISLASPDVGRGTATAMWLYTNDTYTDPGVTASDPEDGDITSSIVISGDTVDNTTVGDYTVVYSVTDSFGNTNTVSRLVSVVDNVAPVITLLGNNPQYVLQNSSNVVDPGATANDLEDGDLTSSIVADAYPDTTILGSSNVNYSVTDSQGLTANVLRTVIVTEDVALTITLTGDNPYEIEANGNAYVDPGYSCVTPDGVDISSSVVVDSSSVDTSTIGTYAVGYSVTDYVGRTGTASRTVNVVVVNYPPVVTVTLPGYKMPVGGTYVEYGATATDDLDGDITANIITDISNLDTNTAGTYSITYTVTDSGGLSTTATRSMVVYNNTPPTVTIVGDSVITQTVGGSYTDAGATASDAEQGDLTSSIVVSGDTVDPNVVGDYSINYTVTDEGGLGDSKTRTVHIVADDPTVITLTGGTPYYVEINTTYSEPGYNAIDAEDGDITADVVISGDTVDISTLGDYTVTYSVTDSFGNVTSVDRIVSVVNPPIINLTDDSGGLSNPVYGGINDHTFTSPGATATDSFGNTVTPTYTTTVDPNVEGTYTETFTYTDATSGLTTTVSRTVIIVATLIPTLTILGTNPISQDEDLSYTDAGATASDPIAGDVTANIVTTNDLDTTTAGSYTYNYSIVGTYGDTVTAVRNITIVSTNTVPVITLVGDDPSYWEVNVSPYTDPGATASDTEDGDITGSIVIGGDTVDPAVVGDYNITYDVTDSYGDAATQLSRVIKVVDKPYINLLADGGGNSNPVYLEVNGTPDWSTEAIDYLGNIDAVGVNTVSTLDNTTIGTYTETYDYTGHISGIDATQVIRTVNVIASLDPTITLVGDDPMGVVLGNAFTDPGATALDPIAGDVTANIIVSGDTVDTSTIGSYTVTYTITNSYGRSASVDRVVNVAANVAPVITLVGDNPLLVKALATHTITNFNSAPDYIQNESTNDVIVINDNSITLPAQGGDHYTGAAAIHRITDDHAGTVHNIDVSFTRDDTGFSYFDQDHTDGALQIGFYFGATPEAVPSRGDVVWTYGTRTGVVEVDIPPNPTAPLSALSYIWKDNENATVSKSSNDLVNDAWPVWDSSTIWKIRLRVLDPTRFDIFVWVGGVLAKHHSVTMATSGYDCMVDAIKAITFKHHSYNSSGSETLRNINVDIVPDAIYTDPGATASDTEDGDITANIVVAGDTVDPNVDGTYVVSYSVTDTEAVTTTETRDVIVGGLSYVPSIWLEDDLLGNTANSSLLQGQGEIVVEGTGTSIDWWNKYLNTHIGFTGDFEVSFKVTGDEPWIILDPDENKSDWLSNVNGFARNCATPTANFNNGTWYSVPLPSGATTETGLTAGIKRVGSTMYMFYRAADGSMATLTGTSTATLYLHIWQKGNLPVNTKDLLIDGSPVTDISAWTTSDSTDWNLSDTTKTWYDRGALATDVEDKDITSTIVVSGDTVDLNTVGTYTVTYSVTDTDGNTKSVDRVVTISENTSPEITLLPTAFGETDEVTIAVGYPWVDPGATAVDTQDGDLTASLVLGGDTVDTSTLGIYNITYTVSDVVGATTTATRVLNVVPNRPPEITLIGDDPLVIEVGGTYTDPGATATDPEVGDISGDIVVGGDTVDPNTIGDYDVTYDVTDVDGEAADTQIRRVEIVAAGTIQNQSATSSDTITDTASAPLVQEVTSATSTNTTSDINDSDPSTTSLTITDAS